MTPIMRIFVSHSHKDAVFCRTLVAALRAANADVWYDEHDMIEGPLGSTIDRELRSRPVFIVILSPHALDSEWVRDECNWAYILYRRNPTRIILPILIEAIDENSLWLFMADFVRVEAPTGKPYLPAEAIRETLRRLSLTQYSVSGEVKALPGESADSLIERGRVLLLHGNSAAARSLLEQATKLIPWSPNAWFDLGFAYLMQDRYAEAAGIFDRVIAITPNDTAAWTNKGTALFFLNRFQESLEASDKALL